MPVKTRKPSRRNITESRKKRLESRSLDRRYPSRANAIAKETETVASIKRGIAMSHVNTLRRAGVFAARVQRPQILSNATFFTPKSHVSLLSDIWYDLLAHNPDLCYLSLSGQFSRKDGYNLKTESGTISIVDAFRVLSPSETFQGPYVIAGGQRVAYSPQFTDHKIQVAINSAVQFGKNFATNLSIEQYLNLFKPGTDVSNMDYGFPFDSSFSEAIAYILKKNNISLKAFMERSHLDQNIYYKLKKSCSYIPERATCKAILFAVRPTIKQAIALYELSKNQFLNTIDDLMLLTFFALFDYDIDKYNEVMKEYGYPPLGSKSYNIPLRYHRR